MQVQHYHQFVPWCQRSTIVAQKADEYLEAELEVGFQVITERYTSKVTLQKPNFVKSSVANSDLFDHLDSSWSIQKGPNAECCWLTFKVDFAFRNPLYRQVADLFFSEVVECMMSAFEDRCSQMYGPSSMLACSIGSRK